MSAKSRERREKFQKLQEAREIEGLVKRARFWDKVNFREHFAAEAVIFAQQIYDGWVDELGNPDFGQRYVDWIGGEDFCDDLRGLGIDGAEMLTPPFKRIWLEYVSQGSWVHADQQVWGLDKSLPFDVGIELSTSTTFDPDIRYVSGNVWRTRVTGQDAVYVGGFWFSLMLEIDDQPLWNFEFEDSDGSRGQGVGTHFTLTQAALVAVRTLQFMNARNIVLIDHASSNKVSAEYERKLGVRSTVYKVLGVKSAIKRLSDAGKPQQAFEIMPLHSVRGHWAHYTPEKPQFGVNHPRNIGRIWKQPHIRGSEKNGMVVKDYKVSR